MRRFVVLAAVAIGCAGIAQAQQTDPQTARQALIEMFFSKTPGTFLKHLPAATREAFDKSGAMANLQGFSMMTSQWQAQGQTMQSFETGSMLVSAENSKTGEKFEVTVENDALRGDQDDIELSFQTYKDGKAQLTPFKPQITFSMKQEAEIWKLNEIAVTVHFPLADPEFLKTITDRMKAQPAVSAGAAQRPEVTAQPAGSDTMVLTAMRTILTAEKTYASTYSAVGYTCTLSDLDGFGGGEPNEHQAMLINSGLASGKRFGFLFTLTAVSYTHLTLPTKRIV